MGIDIGTSSIKVVQLKKGADQYALETYGIVKVAYQRPSDMQFDVITETASILRKLMTEAGVTTRKVVASLPNNIVFVSVIDMPPMSDKELKSAIEWEAQRYVPLPLEEVTLSWSVLEKSAATGGQLQVLLTAVPTTVIDNYLKMFKLADLQPLALEIEALALIRSLVGSRQDGLILIDIGARTTSLNLIDKGYLRVSRNLPVGGETITDAIGNSLHVSPSRAEQFKRDLGLVTDMQQIPQTIRPVIDSIKNEVQQLIKIFGSGGGAIQEIIFSGAGTYVPGLLKFFEDIGPKCSIGDPLKFVSYSPKLKANLDGVSLSLSVALGLAMRD